MDKQTTENKHVGLLFFLMFAKFWTSLDEMTLMYGVYQLTYVKVVVKSMLSSKIQYDYSVCVCVYLCVSAQNKRNNLPNLGGIQNLHHVEISCCSSRQQFPMQQPRNCKHLPYRSSNHIMHILVPCIPCRKKYLNELSFTKTIILFLLDLRGSF